jgi:hypothetical protein
VLTWTRGNPETLIAEMRLVTSALTEEVAASVLKSAHLGADDMQNTIVTSTTKTGEERARRGAGAPGRIDTSDMFNDVKSEGTLEGNVAIGRIGWLNRPQDYYLTQDNTAYSGKPPMHALFNAFVKASEDLLGRMARIARTGKDAQ